MTKDSRKKRGKVIGYWGYNQRQGDESWVWKLNQIIIKSVKG